MSYDISLTCPVTKKTLTAEHPHQMAGGTHQIGGTVELWLNITYNYTTTFKKVLGVNGLRSLYGRTGFDSISVLEPAISQLNDDSNGDYWAPTEGNAKAALIQLLTMARMRPDGIWAGD